MLSDSAETFQASQVSARDASELVVASQQDAVIDRWLARIKRGSTFQRTRRDAPADSDLAV